MEFSDSRMRALRAEGHTSCYSQGMSRRTNGAYRCTRCRLHQSLCLCAHLPALDLATRLVVVMHRAEVVKTTNTGVLATQCLVRSEVHIHGDPGVHVAPPDFTGRRAFVLFPADDAVPLTPALAHGPPISLVVPDGNWRQADKMTTRIPWMRVLPRVTLPLGTKTTYRLRSEPKAGGLATMEAIARAFGVLEGRAAEDALTHVFRLMVERTLFTRGLLPRDDVYGGIEPHVRIDRPWQTNEAGKTPQSPLDPDGA
jgi:DTW domain-containing protein YfiP